MALVLHQIWGNSCIDVYLPLQAVSGNGSQWKRPSKYCRATNLSTPSTCGGFSSAAPRPMETPSSRARHRTTTTPIIALLPTQPQQVAWWAPPADRTAPKPFVLSSSDSSLKVCTALHESDLQLFYMYNSLSCRTDQSHCQNCVKRLMTEQEELVKLTSLWIWLKVNFSFPGKLQTDELKFEKRKLQALMVWMTWWRNAL